MTGIFPIVYAIEYFDFETLQTLTLTSKSIKFVIKDIPYLFPPVSKPFSNIYGGNAIKILTVGDGNLSFSYSLAYFFHTHLPEINFQLTATTFDSYSEVTKKYPETSQGRSKVMTIGLEGWLGLIWDWSGRVMGIGGTTHVKQ